MDQVAAIKLANNYLKRVKKSQIAFLEAWLFGSYAKGTANDSSDIDLAIVLDDRVDNSFETEVNLMVLREGEETMIEPHVFSKAGFDESLPIVKQIKEYGLLLNIN
jgi:predicted nucleotidyltransferase